MPVPIRSSGPCSKCPSCSKRCRAWWLQNIPTAASKPHGYEIVGIWPPARWLTLDASYTASKARYDNGDFIPNAFENAVAAGIAIISNGWEVALLVRHLALSPLIEDNSIRDRGSTIFNLRGAKRFGHVDVYGDVLNLFNNRDKDIAYYYELFILGFDATPIDGRLSRVIEPRTLRIGLKVTL